ncbi:pilin glycosylation ligase domain-containing protein, partial [Escherichia coli]|nr:pilin glycosylation ligase domain-containing protein [Escherichia coli]
RMWGNLNQPNHVGSYLAFGLAACVFVAQEFKRWRLALAVIAVIFLLGMALTISRVTWLHVVVVGALAGLAWSASARGLRRWLAVGASVLLLVAVYEACNWFVSYANVLWHLDLPGSLGERMQEGVGPRAALWQHA